MFQGLRQENFMLYLPITLMLLFAFNVLGKLPSFIKRSEVSKQESHQFYNACSISISHVLLLWWLHASVIGGLVRIPFAGLSLNTKRYMYLGSEDTTLCSCIIWVFMEATLISPVGLYIVTFSSNKGSFTHRKAWFSCLWFSAVL